MVVKMAVRPIAKLSEGRCNGSNGLRPFLVAIRQQTLCLDAALKASLSRDQLRGWRGLDGSSCRGARDARHRSEQDSAAALERRECADLETANRTRLA
jgi:hypothetical protein